MSPNGNFIYYGDGQVLRVHNRARKQTTDLLKRDAFYVTVSARGDMLAFAGPDENDDKTHIYTVALNPATGLPVAGARRVTADEGDTPSFSPDGKWLAYADFDPPGHQRVAIIPVGGGPERILARHPGGIEPIRWAPDGRSIVYGAEGGTYRINLAVAGATPVRTVDKPGYPGLSPDGRLLVVDWHDSEQRVFDSTGKLLSVFSARDDPWLYDWSSPSKSLGIVWAETRLIQASPLAGGRATSLNLPPGELVDLRWSPDGKRVAVARHIGARKWEVIVMNPDGSGQRACPVPDRADALKWSPDAKYVAYRSVDAASPAPYAGTEVGVVDAAACAYTRIVRAEVGFPHWTRDSKRVQLSERADTLANPAATYRWRIVEHTLTGGRRVLEESSGAPPAIAGLTDTTRLYTDAPEGGVMLGRANEAKRTVLFPSGLRHSVPSLSDDGHWMAIRSGQEGNFNTLHVMRTDGTERTTINLPFAALPSPGNPVFLPGNREVVLAGSTTSADSLAFYRVNVATKSVNRILTVRRPGGRTAHEFTVSPDGATLMFATRKPPHSTIVEFDLSAYLKLLK
jgi:Tol biopolymer transport system component